MATLVRGVQKSTNTGHNPAIDSLEAIYAIETIDVRSIRKISTPVVEEVKNAFQEELAPPQAVADLGPFYRDYLPSCVLQEPIYVLALPKHLEKWLLERQVLTLAALRESSLTGLGGGHIEDIKNALKAYLLGKPLQKALEVDFLSLLKCAAAHIERKALYLLLEPYKLTDWLLLSPMEKVEMKKLSKEAMLLLRNNALKEVKTDFLKNQMSLLVSTWICPWMTSRMGATGDEIEERLLLKSKDDTAARHFLHFIKELGISLDQFLLETTPGLFVATAKEQLFYQEVEAKLRSYFVHSATYYSFNELACHLIREFALQWKHLSIEILKKILLNSPLFAYIRDQKGNWLVKQSFL